MFVHSTHQQTYHRAEAACKPMSKVAPLTCIRLQTKFAFPSYSSTAIHVSKHAPSCIFCCYGLLVFDRNFPSHCASCSAKANISQANKHCLTRRNLQEPPSRSRMDGSADSILWGPETAPWGPDRAPCLPPDLAESARPPPTAWVCKLLAGSASPLPQNCQVVIA